ncbi:hypothetical protein [Spongiactinospora gelatinilytica]|nr:hypothetical protein [Spongiactinospora gelatinilytica]
MTGFLGDSDRPDHRRLYFTRALDYYAEFSTGDVIDMTTVARDEEPFRGEEATQVSLRRDAMVEFTRTRTGRPLDEFDLDVRFGRSRSGQCIPGLTDTRDHDCQEPTAAGGGDCVTPGTCAGTVHATGGCSPRWTTPWHPSPRRSAGGSAKPASRAP